MKTNDPNSDLSNALVLSWAAVSSKAQDKYSIADQLKLERDWCKKFGATLVDELVVRGFSRDFWTLADVVAAAAHDPEMEAFARLQAHIRKKSFTIFLCLDADRFGRTQSLVHEVIGRITTDCEALIYTLIDGVWMDKESAPMIGTLKAYKAQHDITRLKEYRVTGMDNRAQDGLSTTAVMPIFHRRIRNEKGAEIEVVVNEDLRPLWTDLAALILRGVSWNQMERTLFEEFGHGRNGKPYRVGYFHDLVTSPAWWGHAALNYRQRGARSTKGVAPWIWDAAVPPPPEVTVYRNRLPPVYSGEWTPLGEQIKAELWRRYGLRGKATAGNTFRFHGLLVCAQCGYTLTLTIGRAPKKQRYIRCATYYDHRYGSRGIDCDQRGYMTEEVVQDYFDQQLRAKLKGLPSVLFDLLQDTHAVQRRIASERERIQRLQTRMAVWADEIADAPPDGRETYRAKIKAASEEIAQVKGTVQALETELAVTEDMRRAQAELFTLLETNDVSWLWEQPDTLINQTLSAALGHNQVVVRDRQIVGTIPAQNQALLQKRGWSRRKK
jgi:hypothetical protein